MNVGPVQLLNPAALWLLPLLPVLVFLARRLPHRQRLVVSSLHLWLASDARTADQISRTPKRRDLILLLQAAFVCAVIAALARPILPAAAEPLRVQPASAPAGAPTSSLAPAASRTVSVRLLSSGNFFLSQALASNPAIALVTDPRASDVVVCDGCAAVPAGTTPALVIPAAAGGAAALPLSVRLHDHPLAQGIDRVLAAPAVPRLADDGDVVIRAGATPLVVAREERGRRIVTLNANLRDGSFPLTSAFPVLIANSIEWLAAKDTPPASAVSVPPVNAAEPRDLGFWLLIAALVIVAAEWRLSARIRPNVHRWRVALCACLLLAIAAVALPIGRSGTAVTFVLDRSSSIPLRVQRAAVAQIDAMAAPMRQNDRLGLVTFGADASLDLKPGPLRGVPDAVSTVSESATNIERALAVARATMASDASRRIVLLSDGNETSGRATREAAAAAAAHVAIDVVPLDATAMSVVPTVQSVHAPDDVRAGAPFTVAVELAGRPRTHATMALADDAGGRIERDVVFDAEGYAAAEFTERQEAAGIYSYRAVLAQADGDDVAGGAAVNVLGPPQVLYVSAGSSSTVLTGPLSAAGIRVTPMAPPAVPLDEGSLARFDAVVLDDVSPDALSAAQMTALTRYVEQRGGGLLVLGSGRTLDPAGYGVAPLGAILPIDLSPRTGRRAPSMAFALVFDKSGSMADRNAGVTKIELARESAMRVVSMLPATDSLGIIAFDAQPRIVTPLAAGTRADDVSPALRAIEPGGSTAIGPAVEMASSWMRGSTAARKHVLLITDGRTSDPDAARLRGVAAAGGFELSVIAIGADADRPLLEAIAARTGGRAYFPESVRDLPALVARDASQASGGTIVNEPFQVRAPRPHPILAGIAAPGLPRLQGYVVGGARSGAETILASHLGDPVLASWRVGAGRVGMFTADLRGPWSAGMRQWNGFAALWVQTTRWLLRQPESDLLHLRAVETDDGIDLRIDAERDGQPVALSDPRITVRTPAGATMELTPQPIAAGRYVAHASTTDVGTYQFAAAAAAADTRADAHLVRGFFRSGERERAVVGVNRSGLAQLAEATGGRLLKPGDSPYAGPRPFAWVSLRPLFALASLLLLLADLTVRTSWWHARRTAAPAREAA